MASLNDPCTHPRAKNGQHQLSRSGRICHNCGATGDAVAAPEPQPAHIKAFLEACEALDQDFGAGRRTQEIVVAWRGAFSQFKAAEG